MNRIALLGYVITAAALAQTPKFELADVHVSKTSHFAVQSFGGVLRAGKYVNRDVTMLGLVESAYGVKADTIAGGPGWVDSDLFDVVAQVPEGTKMVEANRMLQSLLAERFHLVVKHGTHPTPRYILTVGKGGSKLKAASGSGGTCKPVGQQGPGGGGRGGAGDPASIPNIVVECQGLTSQQIGENLRQMAGGYLDRDVIDETKLTGTFDFTLEWTGRGQLAAKGAEGISVFDAVDKQLGLKLESKDVPLPSLVIENVDRKPGPNPPGAERALALAAARFEAASIKPAAPDSQFVGLLYTGGSMMRAGGTLRQLVAMALQLSPNLANDLVVGLPKFADGQRWEINAKVPSTGEGAPNVVNGRPLPPPLSIGLEMLNGLMIDRFGMQTHTENREIPVYALVVKGGKPKMSQAKESERSGCKPDPSAPPPMPGIQMIGCKNTSMSELAETLARFANAYIDHPIVDATGLEGGWDFLVGWTPRGLLQQAQAASSTQPGGAEAASDPTGMTVFEAVDKELGLKLVKQTRSYPVMVVDHIGEKPVE
jgi:uncharacterized protein (TIGR03435 family)